MKNVNFRTTYRTSFVVVAFVFCGCSGDGGPARFGLSGKVTLRGQPVPAGMIVLEPDAAKGNKGPGTSAVIKDGTYATPDGLGIVGGPYIARISAFDGKQFSGDQAEMKPMGDPLAAPKEFHLELPKNQTTYNFEITK